MIKVGDKYPSRNGEREYLVVYISPDKSDEFPVLVIDTETNVEDWLALDGSHYNDGTVDQWDIYIPQDLFILVGQKYKNKHLVNKTIEVLAVFDNMDNPVDRHVAVRINGFAVSIYQENYIKEYYELVE